MTKFIQNDLNIDFHKGGKVSAKNGSSNRVDELLNTKGKAQSKSIYQTIIVP
jgi:hypothetical protein